MLLVPLAAAGTLSGLVSANGFGAVTYEVDDTRYGVLDRFSDHLYSTPSATAPETWDLLYDSYFGLRADGESLWLTSAASEGIAVGTGVLGFDRSRGALTIREYAFAPMGLDHPGFVQLLHVTNDGPDTVTGVSVFSLHNYHLGDENTPTDEVISEVDGALVERGAGTGLEMAMVPVTPGTVGCDDVWATVNAGEDYLPGCDSAGDDRVGGFQWDLGDLAAGQEAWVGVVDVFSTDGSGATWASEWLAGRDEATLLDDELASWEAWHGEPPAGASDDEASAWRQMMAWLRMAQVREEGDAYGQIVASLPYADGDFTHVWNIAWARDGAYAARALAEGGHPDEAAAALRFLASEKQGDYAPWLGLADYAVSVCRYYGDGAEWSDDDGTGPNIELDDWGLYLWALRGAVEAGASMDAEVAAAGPGVGDPLVALIDETGLLTEDSSIWERHWDGRKHFTYSSAWAVRGLRDLAVLSGDEAYADAADGIAAAMGTLFRDGVLMGNAEETDALDLAAVDAFGNGAVDADIGPSLDAWAALATPSRGYKRNDDGDAYDEQEWIFVDLRLADALFRACRTTEGQALLDHVTAVALDNDLVLPELLDPETAEVEGPAPMIGFGAGVYALALHARADTVCEGDSGGTDSGTDSDEPGDSEDPGDRDSGEGSGPKDRKACGCATGEGVGGSVFALGWVFSRRRRRDPRGPLYGDG